MVDQVNNQLSNQLTSLNHEWFSNGSLCLRNVSVSPRCCSAVLQFPCEAMTRLGKDLLLGSARRELVATSPTKLGRNGWRNTVVVDGSYWLRAVTCQATWLIDGLVQMIEINSLV